MTDIEKVIQNLPTKKDKEVLENLPKYKHPDLIHQKFSQDAEDVHLGLKELYLYQGAMGGEMIMPMSEDELYKSLKQSANDGSPKPIKITTEQAMELAQKGDLINQNEVQEILAILGAHQTGQINEEKHESADAVLEQAA